MSNATNRYYSKNWRSSMIKEGSSIKNALEAISNSGALMACICAADGKLLGIVTDSDIRRALLNGAWLDECVDKFANYRPILAEWTLPRSDLLIIATTAAVREVPLIDAEGKLADIFVLTHHQDREISESPRPSASGEQTDSPMLILAGGQGMRLRPVVSDRPKSLAIVGDRPILETLIENAAKSGVRKFYIAVNYMSDQIVRHLEDSKYSDFDIRILYEKERLGTAGAISLIEDRLDKPLLVCNADVLSTVAFGNLVRHHCRENADLTCSVRPYDFTIPFGVFELANGVITGVREKPRKKYLLNAGIYAVAPALCELVPKIEKFDMTDLIASACAKGKKVSPFLLHEYWIDVGQPEDYLRANEEFQLHFGN
jgi:dTDP-glucose pyrophosphorylase